MGDTTVTGDDNIVVEDNSDDAMQIWVDAVGAKQCSWQAVLAQAIGTFGFIRQFELQSRMVDCAEEQKQQAQEYLELTQQQYEEVFRPIYTCVKDAFVDTAECYEQYEKQFVALAFECPEYEPDYVSQQGRVLGVVQAQFDNAAKQRRRTLGKHDSGKCKNEDLRIALATATAKTDALNAAYRYEEARRDRYEEVYWNRKVQAIQVTQNIFSRVFGSLTSSGNVVANGLGTIGTAFGRSLDAYGAFASATSGLSDLFGTLANGAFQFAGYQSFGRPGFNSGLGGQAGFNASTSIGGGVFNSIGGLVSHGAGAISGLIGGAGLFGSSTPPAFAGFANSPGT